MSKIPVIQHAALTARHIKRGVSTDLGAVQVLGDYWVPQRNLAAGKEGLNGRRGFQSGSYERRLGEEGAASLVFPNSAGGDGRLHRRRFEALRQHTAVETPYRVGDEWVELYRDGELLIVLTPLGGGISRSQVGLRGADAFWLLKHSRETNCGFWCHAPRDVWEHYTQVWKSLYAEDWRETTVAWSGVSTLVGDFNYLGAATDHARGVVRLEGRSTVGPFIIGVGNVIGHGVGHSLAHCPWRIETRFRRGPLTTGDVTFGLMDGSSSSPAISIQASSIVVAFYGGAAQIALVTDPDTPVTLAIEGRDRWVFYYVNEVLVFVGPAKGTQAQQVPFLTTTEPNSWIDVDYIRAEQAQPFLLRGSVKGDYRLPGALTPGGLSAKYFNEPPLSLGPAISNPEDLLLRPNREPTLQRVDPAINFTSANPPTFAGGLGENFSVRWTGAIYLDLAATDVLLRTRADPRVRVWVGKTRWGEQLIETWLATPAAGFVTTTSGSLRTHLGGSVAGWYPIVIEFGQTTGAAGIVFEISTNGGSSWALVGQDKLSPLGIFETQVQNESHYEMIRTLIEQYGFQTTLEPRSLESGEFPGQLIPRVRKGRDTEKVLTGAEATDLQTEVAAEESVDELVADAAGLAKDGAQLTVRHLNFDEAMVHPFLHQEAELLSEITIKENLVQRLDSLLALRSSPWEEVGAKPTSRRELLDAFPLTGSLAAFNWEPGDSVRLDLEELDVKDTTPRQIMGVSWPFVPDGLGQPDAAFRQRPRSFRETLRRLQRQALAPQRTYQGQLARVTGTQAAAIATATIVSLFSAVNLPDDLSTVLKAELVVQAKTDASSMAIEVNGTDRLNVTTIGRYDVTPWVAAFPATRYMLTRMTGGTGAAPRATYALELTIRI